MVRLTTGNTSVVSSSADGPQRSIKRSGVTLSVAFWMRRTRASLNHCAVFTMRNCAKRRPATTRTTLPAMTQDCLLALMSVSFIARQPFCACSNHRSAGLSWGNIFGGRRERVTLLYEAIQTGASLLGPRVRREKSDRQIARGAQAGRRIENHGNRVHDDGRRRNVAVRAARNHQADVRMARERNRIGGIFCADVHLQFEVHQFFAVFRSAAGDLMNARHLSRLDG